MKKCSPKGRDCFERNFFHTFNCSATCEGVYADVQWEDDPIMNEEDVREEMETLDKKLMRTYKMYPNLERKMKLMIGNKVKMGEEIDKEKFRKLISEYKKFKMENVRHIKFHPNATSNMFGRGRVHRKIIDFVWPFAIPQGGGGLFKRKDGAGPDFSFLASQDALEVMLVRE